MPGKWRYHYPQAAFPYQELIEENGGAKEEPEYELIDTGVFDGGRYWIVEVHYAKADPHDLLMKIQVTNAGPDTETLHVLPTAWFRNTWSWDLDAPRPRWRRQADTSVGIDHPWLGRLEFSPTLRRTAGRRGCFVRTSRISNACTAWSRSRHIRRTASTIT